MEVGGRGRLYLSLHCHHQNDSCIKMGSDDGHFNVSLIVRDKVTRQCPQTTTFEEKGEPKRYRTEVLPLTSLPPYRQANRLSVPSVWGCVLMLYTLDIGLNQSEQVAEETLKVGQAYRAEGVVWTWRCFWVGLGWVSLCPVPRCRCCRL